MTFPLQPVYRDERGILRFRPNLVVVKLTELCPGWDRAMQDPEVSDEDREQFATLIGFTLAGFCELSFVSDVAIAKALSARLEVIDDLP